MSGLEVLAVVAAVAAVVSAYRDGGEILSNIKKRRVRRQRPKNEDALEKSLITGPPEIEAVVQAGRSRYGQEFLIGDATATSELYRISAELNGVLLEQLKMAVTSDTFDDFTTCAVVSERSRMQSITVLTELQMRIVQLKYDQLSLSVQPRPPQLEPPRPATMFSTTTPTSQTKKTPTTQNRRNSEKLPEPISYFPKISWSRKKDQRHSVSSSSRPHSIASHASAASGSSSTTSPVTTRFPHTVTSPTETELMANPWQEQRQHSVESPSSPESSRSSQFIPMKQRQESFHSTSEPPISPERTNTVGEISTRPSRNLMPLPRSDNDYLGLCPRAAYFQTLDLQQCFSTEKEPAFSSIPYLMCRTCAFTGKISRTQVHSHKGVSLRWAFLAKSHVNQKRVKNGVHQYRCLFCIFLGDIAPILEGNDALFAHLSGHRGADLGESILQRTRCINDRVADDDEDFDINLCPPYEETSFLSKQSTLQSLPEVDSAQAFGDYGPWAER